MEKVVSLKLNKEFKRAYYQGKFKAHPFLVTYLVKNRSRVPRVGITTSKKIGCAVKRNRARRIIKQAYREILSEKALNFSGYDLVFVARNDTPLKNTSDIKRIMKKQIGVLLG
ncbi:MAG: ribonuclease P protein component [Oscillospiraceae bacterium]